MRKISKIIHNFLAYNNINMYLCGLTYIYAQNGILKPIKRNNT